LERGIARRAHTRELVLAVEPVLQCAEVVSSVRIGQYSVQERPFPRSNRPLPSAVDSSACPNQYDERPQLRPGAEDSSSSSSQVELLEVRHTCGTTAKGCTRDDLRESRTTLVLGMHRMTTLHGTVTARGALEAFVSLFAATTNVSVSGGAPTHGRRSYSSARRGLRTPSASIHTKSQRMPKKSGSNRSSTDHARR
jgi:hypothetical protein